MTGATQADPTQLSYSRAYAGVRCEFDTPARSGWSIPWMPPSTLNDAPVMNAASSDARNRAMFAISLGLPIRPIGWYCESTLYCEKKQTLSVPSVGVHCVHAQYGGAGSQLAIMSQLASATGGPAEAGTARALILCNHGHVSQG